MPQCCGVSVATHMELILKSLNKYIQFDLIVFLGQNVHVGPELTKSLSSTRLLGVVRFRSRVKRSANIFGSNFFT